MVSYGQNGHRRTSCDLNKVSEYFDELVMLNRKLIVQGPVDETYQLANIQKTYSQRFRRTIISKK